MTKVIVKKKFNSSQIRRILIRGVNWVGDTVLTTPAIRALRQGFPQAHIAIVVKPWVADLLKRNPYLDEVIIYDPQGEDRGLIGYFKFLRKLRKRREELAILFPNSFAAALMAYLAGIPYRVGYNTDGRGFLLTTKIIRDKKILKKHQVEYYLNIIKGMGLKVRERELVIKLAPEDRHYARQLLKKEGINKDDLLIGMNPGAFYGPAKRWFPERFAQLANELISRYGAKIVIFGNSRERKIAEEIGRLLKTPPLNVAGKTTLLQLAALIERCHLFVTNDSGSMHIAAAVKTPIVAIFGSTDPQTTSPYGSGHLIVRKELPCSPCLKETCPKDYECMKLVTVQDVLPAVERQLRKIGRRGEESNVGVFIDRDGTITEELGYLEDIDKLCLLPRVAEAIKLLNKNGIKTIVATNQSGVARGYFKEELVQRMHKKLNALLNEAGAYLDAIYYCPHYPEGRKKKYVRDCSCRKPKPGMLKRGEREFTLDLNRCYTVGDKVIDVQFGQGVGGKGILVLTGYGREELRKAQAEGLKPDYVASGLYEAVEWILKDCNK